MPGYSRLPAVRYAPATGPREREKVAIIQVQSTLIVAGPEVEPGIFLLVIKFAPRIELSSALIARAASIASGRRCGLVRWEEPVQEPALPNVGAPGWKLSENVPSPRRRRGRVQLIACRPRRIA